MIQISVDQDISVVKDCLEAVTANKALLKADVIINEKERTIEIRSDDDRSQKKTEATIKRYLRILDKIKEIK